MKTTWIGQGGFVFESEGRRLVVDAYLSDVVERRQGVRRLAPPPFAARELRPDYLLCTHDHMDHLDPETVPELARLRPECVVIGPSSVASHCVGLGIPEDRIILLDKGDRKNFGPFDITAVRADHSDPLAVGLLVRAGGKTTYLSGDTLFDAGIADEVRAESGGKVDAMLVCINGRLGNMSLDDAVRLVSLIRPSAAFPMHYGLFAENTADPAPFVKKCGEMGVRSMELPLGGEVEI